MRRGPVPMNFILPTPSPGSTANNRAFGMPLARHSRHPRALIGPSLKSPGAAFSCPGRLFVQSRRVVTFSVRLYTRDRGDEEPLR